MHWPILIGYLAGDLPSIMQATSTCPEFAAQEIWLHNCSNNCMNTETLVGISASACTAVSLIPQLIKVLKEKKAADVSLWMLIILFLGLGLWVYYGILKQDIIIIVSNSFSLIINMLLAVFAIKYKSR